MCLILPLYNLRIGNVPRAILVANHGPRRPFSSRFKCLVNGVKHIFHPCLWRHTDRTSNPNSHPIMCPHSKNPQTCNIATADKTEALVDWNLLMDLLVSNCSSKFGLSYGQMFWCLLLYQSWATISRQPLHKFEYPSYTTSRCRFAAIFKFAPNCMNTVQTQSSHAIGSFALKLRRLIIIAATTRILLQFQQDPYFSAGKCQSLN